MERADDKGQGRKAFEEIKIVEFVTITAITGPRPAKGRPPTSTLQELMRIEIPTEDLVFSIRMMLEAFSIELWAEDDAVSAYRSQLSCNMTLLLSNGLRSQPWNNSTCHDCHPQRGCGRLSLQC